VTREGGFTNLQNQTNFASIAGEWTVEYDLTPDGIFRLKLYNRNNYNTYNTLNIGQNTGTTGGLSIMHTQSYNTLKELFNFKKKKEEENKDKDNDNSDDDDTFPQTMNKEVKRDDEPEQTTSDDLLNSDGD
jgi:hypothetical protein